MAVTNYLWDPLTDSVVHETDGSNATQATYTNEPASFGPLVSQRRASTSHYFHFDVLGSTRHLTSAAQTVTDSYTPSAWGEEVAAAGTTINTNRWVGRFGYTRTSVSSQSTVRARSYDASAGRWISADPLPDRAISSPGHTLMRRRMHGDTFGAQLGRRQTIHELSTADHTHKYRYSFNSPTVFLDPAGLQAGAANCRADYDSCLFRCIDSDRFCHVMAIYMCAALGIRYMWGKNIWDEWLPWLEFLGVDACCMVLYEAACNEDETTCPVCCDDALAQCMVTGQWPGQPGSFWFFRCMGGL